ncbi:uncharacterized protein EDB93DRAFT_1245847 [Suillus bovinus]|uniref:uncharacterized protein n=1 Tax=Suillus bovinus TaxID=48563 RepID=UPI001B86B44F|nr:uncharacterized protein EDB93DRAFT_1245847 [Suillus bovinus]KAG2158620.1 hypothetical protein EDB93DRAFT_1245847 [Suillus bovinus]
METQIAEFEEAEPEWAINKVLNHSGKRADSTFQILWKSGDTTWLSYNWVAGLGALKDYFLELGIEDVSELEQGTGNLAAADPQVSVGCLDFNNPNHINPVVHPSSESSFSFTSNDSLLLLACQITPSTMAPILSRIGALHYTLPNGIGNGDLMIVLDMLRAYLEHNAHLRSGTAMDRASPVGYGDFSLSFNMLQNTNGLTSRFVEESVEGPRISGPSPYITDLVGEETPPTPSICSSASQPPPDGGCWLNPQHVELVEEALWQNMKTSKRQQEWWEHSIAERQATKRARHAARGSPSTFQITDTEEGPSSGAHTSACHSPTTHTPITPTQTQTTWPPGQMEVDEPRDSAKDKDHGEGVGKGKTKKK